MLIITYYLLKQRWPLPIMRRATINTKWETTKERLKTSAKPSDSNLTMLLLIATEDSVKTIYKTTKEQLKTTAKPSDSNRTTLMLITTEDSANTVCKTIKERLKTTHKPPK